MGRLSGILALKYQVSVCHVINKIVVEEGTVGEGLQMSLLDAPKVSHGLNYIFMTRDPPNRATANPVTYRAFPSRNGLTPEGADDRRDVTSLTSTSDYEHN